MINPREDPGRLRAQSRAARTFHGGHPEYAPTPLTDLPPLARACGVGRVLVKDETTRMGLPAFKALGASWALERALARNPSITSVVTASAGNHGRAVAHFAARRGLPCTVVVPARCHPVRRAAIEAEDAAVEAVDGTYEDAVVRAGALARAPGVAEIADVGASPSAFDVIDGYATLFAEIQRQHAEPPDVLLVPVGVGSFGAAATRAAAGTPTRVVAVEPARAACLTESLRAGQPVTVPTPGSAMAGMDCAEVSEAAWPDLRAGVAGTVTVEEAEVPPAVERLRSLHIAGGECSGAALAALTTLATSDQAAPLREHLALDGESTIVVLATEGDTASAFGAS